MRKNRERSEKKAEKMLNRLGNKSKLLPQLLPLFPARIMTFVDMFAGSLAVSVAMLSKAKYVISNDYDSDVSNLFDIWRTRPAELAEALSVVPYHADILQRWKKSDEPDPLWRAVAFVYQSNFSLMSKGETLKFGQGNARALTLQAIREGFEQIQRIQFMSCDFRECLDKICWRHARDREQAFIYADPPYCQTENNYNAPAWTTNDTRDLFEMLGKSSMRFAVSEFDSDIIRALASKHGLRVHRIGERRNIGNRRTEVLITNYETHTAQASLFEVMGKKAA